MSSGTVTITVDRASISEASTFFVEVNACNQSYVTSIVRNQTQHDFKESFEFEFDSDVHSPSGIVHIKTKGNKTPVATFPIPSLLSSFTTTLTSDNKTTTCTLTSKYTHDLGHNPTRTNYLFPLSYLLIFLCWLLPQHYPIPYHVNLLLTSTVLIYLGSHLSLILRDTETILDSSGNQVQQSMGETMSQSDAQRFPLVGSAALFSLFLAFKFLDPEWVNFVISFYFTAAGSGAVLQTVYPIVKAGLEPYVKWSWKKEVHLEWENKIATMVLGESPFKETIEINLPGIISALLALFVGHQYFTSKHWTLNNILGICFILQGISMFSIGSFKIAAILLIGLFFYDVFWVFGTPVMVTVAKKLDGPIKLLFPRSLEKNSEGKINLSLLGLGDIVIPGFLVSFMLRFDAVRSRVPTPYSPMTSSFPKPYFHTILISYLIGLATTLVMMTKFNAAQPALLYLVPACLGSVLICGALRGELKEVWEYSEEEPDPMAPVVEGEKEKEKKKEE
ncbi:hypothetical protein TrVE_jg12687 [Triparma verrucosa]|uniref:Signal peptide peptidase n=1 Tax=Triparma verrucosa TaxID=1606542 RepID=A0A9W7BXC6_9STRA|nr:hypothetical protein TrVE_jg12687 [Triparma verrucosa]